MLALAYACGLRAGEIVEAALVKVAVVGTFLAGTHAKHQSQLAVIGKFLDYGRNVRAMIAGKPAERFHGGAIEEGIEAQAPAGGNAPGAICGLLLCAGLSHGQNSD